MNLDITHKELMDKSVDELKQLRNELARYIDTPDEKRAKQLAQEIREIICIKSNYGF